MKLMLVSTRKEDRRMTHGAAIGEAIERLYQLFTPYPAPVRLEASPLRDADAIQRALRSAPLRELEGEQVLPYATWAITTVGGADDYRHFLPRIIELALDDPPDTGAEPAVIAGKMDLPRRNGRWTAEERAAVRAAFLAAWGWALAQDPARIDAERWLVGLARMGGVADALDIWRNSPSPHAVGHLAQIVCENKRFLGDGRGFESGFWDGVAPEVRKVVTDWMRSADVRQWLGAARVPADPGVQWWIEDARDVLSP